MVPLAFAGALGAAAGEMASPCSAAAAPTSFDYVVFASMADSQHPISMAGYRPAPLRHEASR
jgi:hypothetical protein